MAAIAADRHLLLGLLALQNGLIDQAQLVAAFQAWTLRQGPAPGRPPRRPRPPRAPRSAGGRGHGRPCTSRHHGGDAEKSLAAVPAGRSTRESLAAVRRPGRSSGPCSRRRLRSHSGRRRRRRPHRQLRRRHGHLRRPAVPRPPAPRPRRPGRRLRRPGRRAAPRGGAEADPRRARRRPGQPPPVPARGRDHRRAGAPGHRPGLRPGHLRRRPAVSTPCGSSAATASRRPIDRFHADEALKRDPGRRSLELRKLLRRFTRRLQRDRVRPQPRRAAPRHQAGQRHRRQARRDAGRRLGPGQGDRPGRSGAGSGERTLVPSSASGGRDAAGQRAGHAGLHEPRAGRGRPGAARAALGRLQPGRHALLPPDRPAAVRGATSATCSAPCSGATSRRPRQLDPTIDRALEAVCLKAMALRPEDRYASPRALAEDVERWMADEPVSAWREPSPAGRRWARRNRTAVAAAAGRPGGRRGRARRRGRRAGPGQRPAPAGQRRDQHRTGRHPEAQAATKEALAQSEESRRQAEAVSTFLVDAFRSPDPWQDGRQAKVVDVLDRAAEALDNEFSGSQATRGRLLDTLGPTYQGLGLYDKAVVLHEKARGAREATLGRDHPDTLRSGNNLGLRLRVCRCTAEAIPLLVATLGPARPGSAPTTPTRSSAAATSPWPTRGPAGGRGDPSV